MEPKKEQAGASSGGNKGNANSEDEKLKRFKETDFLDDYQHNLIEWFKKGFMDLDLLDITFSVCRPTDCWSKMLLEDRLMVYLKNPGQSLWSQ